MAGIAARITVQNEATLAALVAQLRSPLGVLPFIGAGMSKGLGFPEWGEALRRIGERLAAPRRAALEALLADGKLQVAAGKVAQGLGEEAFQQALADSFDDQDLAAERFTQGPLALLPLVASGPVITTNFDRVLERAYAAAGRPFGDKVYGANPDEVVPALQQNGHILWKIHGDWKDRRTRVFTDKQYAAHYRHLRSLLRLAFTHRPALFLGASLEGDETVTVLAEVQKTHSAITHFAVLQAPAKVAAFDRRAAALRRLGIRPLWYPEGEHGLIEERLAGLLEGLASRPLRRAGAPRAAPAASRPGAVEEAGRSLRAELAVLARDLAIGPDAPADLEPPYTPIVDRIARGGMAFLLGAFANLDRLPLAGPFYDDLARKFGARGDEAEPPRIAQHFADLYGREALYTQVRELLRQGQREPTAVHWLLATLRRRLAAKGYRSPAPIILTTNYDDWMEWALTQAGERYHLFTYRPENPHRGWFVYRDPDGALRLIDRPEAFRRLHEGCTVLVKFHGGLHLDLDLPVAYVFTERDWVELAGRVPAAVPRVLRDRLAERSVLSLGHGLADPSVEALLRVVVGSRRRSPSWAVQWPPNPWQREYWRPLGVDILHVLLQRFMVELDARLEAWPRAAEGR